MSLPRHKETFAAAFADFVLSFLGRWFFFLLVRLCFCFRFYILLCLSSRYCKLQAINFLFFLGYFAIGTNRYATHPNEANLFRPEKTFSGFFLDLGV